MHPYSETEKLQDNCRLVSSGTALACDDDKDWHIHPLTGRR